MIDFDSINLNYGERILFDGISGSITARDRIGLVGSNGSGKSTLLKILMNLDQPDEGNIRVAHYVTTGYLPQEGIELRGNSLYEEVAAAFETILSLQEKIDSATGRLQNLKPETDEYHETLELIGHWEHHLEDHDAFRMKSKIETVLLGLGFSLDDLNRDTGEFSGGWQMRIALAKLLLQEPSLLLLDEPTNHLDLDTLRWLEKYLQKYDGAILVVSHDRAFLDNLCRRTFALSRGKLTIFKGNYSFFEKEAQKRREATQNQAKNQQRKIEKTERFIERFRYKSTKASQVQSRIKALDKIERIEVESEEQGIHFRFPTPRRSGRTVLTLEAVKKSYGSNVVFDGITLEVERGDRLALVGVNGAGKSTLSRIMTGVEPFQEGKRWIGHNVELSWFAQDQAEELDPDRDVLSLAWEDCHEDLRSRIRDVLGAFLFSGDDVNKKAGVLSGGEKNRLALAQMLLKPSNLLILDEPTNHLDMRSKEILQEALEVYEGTYVIVSHDRAFLDPLVTKVLEVNKNGETRLFHGNISDYITKLEEEEQIRLRISEANSENSGGNNKGSKKGDLSSNRRIMNPQERRRLDALIRDRLAPIKKKLSKIENQIGYWEKNIQDCETRMMDPAFFKRGEATNEDIRNYESLKRKIKRAYEDWETLQEQVENENSALEEKYF